MNKSGISNNVIRRLPRYYRKLNELSQNHIERISSGELGRQLGLTPSQIRQDFSCFGEFGQQGYGYNVEDLLREIRKIIGMDRGYTAILIGAGNLGRALLGNFPFSRCGLKLLGAFDIERDLIGASISGYKVMDAAQQADFIEENAVDIAILSVPRKDAQPVTDNLIQSGVRAIWNFTDVEIRTGTPGIVVENIHFSDSLLTLSYYLTKEGN